MTFGVFIILCRKMQTYGDVLCTASHNGKRNENCALLRFQWKSRRPLAQRDVDVALGKIHFSLVELRNLKRLDDVHARIMAKEIQWLRKECQRNGRTEEIVCIALLRYVSDGKMEFIGKMHEEALAFQSD